MTSIAFLSAKHSPGVTTTALAVATALSEQRPTALIEADISGGDLAPVCNLRLDPSIVGFIASSRHSSTSDKLTNYTQRHGDVDVLTAPASPQQTGSAVKSLANLDIDFDGDVVFDMGRFDATAHTVLLHRMDLIVVVLRPTLQAVEHLRVRLESLQNIDKSVGIATIGDRPYQPKEVAKALGVKLLVELPDSKRDVELLIEQPKSKLTNRCRLLQAARNFTGSYSEGQVA